MHAYACAHACAHTHTHTHSLSLSLFLSHTHTHATYIGSCILNVNVPNFLLISFTIASSTRSLDVCGCSNVSDSSIRTLASNCYRLISIDISSTSCTHKRLVEEGDGTRPKSDRAEDSGHLVGLGTASFHCLGQKHSQQEFLVLEVENPCRFWHDGTFSLFVFLVLCVCVEQSNCILGGFFCMYMLCF